MNSYPIVGLWYRPLVVREILKLLPQGAKLILHPEPENIHDPYAVQVLIRGEDIPKTPAVEGVLAGFGISFSELDSSPDWHLGYVKKTFAPEVSVKLQGEDHEAELGFSPSGEPQVRIKDV